MKRILPLALLCLSTSACLDRTTIASASALPAYDLAAQTVLARAAKSPPNDAEKAAIKAADSKLFDALGAINAEEMRKAADLHSQVQGL